MNAPALTVTESRRTLAYGLWSVTVQTEDGRAFTGGGLSEDEANYRARLQAQARPAAPSD